MKELDKLVYTLFLMLYLSGMTPKMQNYLNKLAVDSVDLPQTMNILKKYIHYNFEDIRIQKLYLKRHITNNVEPEIGTGEISK